MPSLPKRRALAERRDLIKKAIVKVEREHPLHEWGPKQIFTEIQKVDKKILYRRLSSHLKRLQHVGYLKKTSHGHYLSKNSLFWKKVVQEFMVNDVIEIAPKLEGEDFEKVLARNTALSTENVKRLQGKNTFQSSLMWLRERLSGQGNRLEDEIALKNWIEADVQERMRKDLRFIENATEITILSSKPEPHINTMKLRATIAEVLYYLILHERYSRIPHKDWLHMNGDLEKEIAVRKKLKKVEDPKDVMADTSLNIMVSFDPKRVPTNAERSLF